MTAPCCRPTRDDPPCTCDDDAAVAHYEDSTGCTAEGDEFDRWYRDVWPTIRDDVDEEGHR